MKGWSGGGTPWFGGPIKRSFHGFTVSMKEFAAGFSDFATTLPKLFGAMCSNRENEGEHAGVKRLNRLKCQATRYKRQRMAKSRKKY
jgi:hypothetical protein